MLNKDVRHEVFTYVAAEDYVGRSFAFLPLCTPDAGWIWLKKYYFFKERVTSSGLHGGHHMKLVDVGFARFYIEQVIRDYYGRVPSKLPQPPKATPQPFPIGAVLGTYFPLPLPVLTSQAGSVADISRKSLALLKKNGN